MNNKNILQLCLVLASSLVLTGCMEFSEEFTLNADGSCEVVLDIGMTQQMVEMAKASGGESPFDKGTFEEDLGDDPNVKDFKVEEKIVGDMSHIIVTATYKDALSGFESIGSAMDQGPEGGGDEGAPKFEKLPNGNLKFTQDLEAGENMGDDPQQAQMVAAMFAGKNFAVKLNGDIVSSNGEVAADKKSVSWKFPLADLMTGKVELKQLEAEIATGKVSPAAKSGGSDGEGAKSGGGALSKILPIAIIGLIVVALVILGMSFTGKKSA